MFLNLFNALLRKKQRVIRVFQYVWLLQCLILFLSVKSALLNKISGSLFWYDIALLCGKTALIFFMIVLTPGIFKRFNIRNRVLGLLMIFRRQFGITMFLFVLIHSLTVSLLPRLMNGKLLQFAVFELFGLGGSLLLFFLFLTSNDFSQAKMGKWWYLLHKLVFIIMWLILIHVAIQRFSVWTVLASILVVSEMTGIFYSTMVRKFNHSQ